MTHLTSFCKPLLPPYSCHTSWKNVYHAHREMVGTCAENADKLTATSGMKMESPGKTQKRPTQRRLVMILREGCDRACMASDGKDRAAMHSGGELLWKLPGPPQALRVLCELWFHAEGGWWWGTLCGSFQGHPRH